jgi:hypothetical protein
MKAARVPEELIDEAERLMIDGAFGKLHVRDPRARDEADLIRDIEAAWLFIRDVLRRQGFKIT